MAVFNRGDIVNVPLDRVELSGATVRPALVLSTQAFNRMGEVLIAPIVQGSDCSRFAGFAIPLAGSGCKTQGTILINKFRLMDLSSRKARKIERAPEALVDDALQRLTAILVG